MQIFSQIFIFYFYIKFKNNCIQIRIVMPYIIFIYKALLEKIPSDHVNIKDDYFLVLKVSRQTLLLLNLI